MDWHTALASLTLAPMRGQARTAICLIALLGPLARAEDPKAGGPAKELRQAIEGLRSSDPEAQDDAVRRLSSQPDQGLALLVGEIPKVAETSMENLPIFLNAFTQTFARASDKPPYCGPSRNPFTLRGWTVEGPHQSEPCLVAERSRSLVGGAPSRASSRLPCTCQVPENLTLGLPKMVTRSRKLS
jgi:hypothetical protein